MNQHMSATLPTDQRMNVQLITPAVASALLAKNAGNRCVRKTMMDRLATVIRAGEWKLSPQGIIIGKSGRLLDGQHRLLAVVQSGIAVQMTVMSNVDEDVFSILDRGNSRSVADALQLDKKLVEVASLLVRFANTRANATTDRRVRMMFEAFISEIVDLHTFCNTTVKNYSVAPIRAAVVLRMVNNPSSDYVKEQYRSLVLGKVGDMSQAVGSLFSAIARGTVSSASREDLLMRAWRAFDEENKDISRIIIKNYDVARAEIVEVIAKRLGDAGMKSLFN